MGNVSMLLWEGGCVCLLLCVARLLQCLMLQLFFFACLNCAGCIPVFSLVLMISRVTSSVEKATVLNCLPLGRRVHWPVGSSAMTGCDFFFNFFFKVLLWQFGIGNRTLSVCPVSWVGGKIFLLPSLRLSELV